MGLCEVLAGATAGLLMLTASARHPDDDRARILDAREEAVITTLLDLEERTDQWGGLEAMYERLLPLQDEITAKLRLPIGRTLPVGKNLYHLGITPGAVHRFREIDHGDNDAVRVIIGFHRQLQELGIDLIAVPVPAKIELCVDDFEAKLPAGCPVSPGRIEAMLALLEAGVEVVDVLPLLERAAPDAEVPLYELHGHHLSGYGAMLAGELVAQRLERYDFPDRDPARFAVRRRSGTERVDPSVSMKVWEVLDATSEPYEHVPDAPVIVIGDSHAFAYFTASWASHIARTAGIAISDISESSGGATAHAKLARMGMESLRRRKVVIWIFTGAVLTLDRFWEPTPLYDEPQSADEARVSFARTQVAEYLRQRANDPDQEFTVPESEVNKLGYEMLGADEVDLAIEIFRIATAEYPLSANAWDSLGEAYIRADQSDLAEEALRHSLTLEADENTRKNTHRLLDELGVPVGG